MSACLEQTLHFQLKEGVTHAFAVKNVNDELAQFKTRLENQNIKFKVIEEIVQPDDSIILKIKRQYNDYDCGDYLA
jgi:hypothetical protein